MYLFFIIFHLYKCPPSYAPGLIYTCLSGAMVTHKIYYCCLVFKVLVLDGDSEYDAHK